MDRIGQQWVSFIEKQKSIILKRLRKYRNVNTAEKSLKEMGNITD
jgi:hypothetical protein